LRSLSIHTAIPSSTAPGPSATPIKGPLHLAVGDKFTVGMRQWGAPCGITSNLERLAARFGG
jgi:hypothetical protein